MIESLSPRLHFVVFGLDQSYDVFVPPKPELSTIISIEQVTGGKTLVELSVQKPLEGYYDEQREYFTRFTRYLPDRTLDRTFGKNGQLDIGTTLQVKVIPGSRIVATYEDRIIRSFTLNARVNTTFNGDGDELIRFNRSSAVMQN